MVTTRSFEVSPKIFTLSGFVTRGKKFTGYQPVFGFTVCVWGENVGNVVGWVLGGGQLISIIC